VLGWPPESERIILALRLVPRSGERFLGVSVRQALVGEGFQHGEFSIFHKPLGDGRVILSIASLTRPGTFEPSTMDAASFAGLNLFTVLPGPLSGRESFERLLLVGRTLAQRLRGELLDQRGQPLDEARLEELRRDGVGGGSRSLAAARDRAPQLPVLRARRAGAPGRGVRPPARRTA
jgi:cell division protein ZipA